MVAELDVQEVWWTDDDTRWEEDWAEALRGMPDARVPLRRFGSGDCRCEGHLVHLRTRPDVDVFRDAVSTEGAACSIHRADPTEIT